jgi:acyl-coenzyme A thioesterase 9
VALAKPTSFKRFLATETPKSTPPREIKTVSDSTIEKVVALSKDAQLRELFTNNWGEVRVGLLLEELDRLAGAVAYKHALGSQTEVVGVLSHTPTGEVVGNAQLEHGAELMASMPIVIVTASVDHIVLFRPLSIKNDLKIIGRVVLVGRSSMEILLQVNSVIVDPQTGRETSERAIEAHFTMVARSRSGDKSVVIPGLQTNNKEEEMLFKRAQEARARRKVSLESSIFTNLPKPQEHEIIHKLFYNVQDNVELAGMSSLKVGTREKDLSAGFIDMQNTFRSSVFAMQPQKRNIHGKVFGGYLMRVAFEQAWCTAYTFSGHLPSFIACDDISFLLPVPLGTLVTFDTTVVYTRPIEDGRHEITVEVSANVLNPAEHSQQTTNTFFYFFRVAKCDLQLIPSRYQDAMKFLDGKRRLEDMSIQRSSNRTL